MVGEYTHHFNASFGISWQRQRNVHERVEGDRHLPAIFFRTYQGALQLTCFFLSLVCSRKIVCCWGLKRNWEERKGKDEEREKGERMRGGRGTLEEVYYNGLISFEMILPCFQADYFVWPTIAFNDFDIGLVLHL